MRQIEGSGDKWVAARITNEQRMAGLRKSHANALARGDIHRNHVTEILVTKPTSRLRGRGMGNVSIADACYPPCPRCNGATSRNTIRAGFARGIQRFRCLFCRSTFSGGTIVIKLEPVTFPLICYHCGGKGKPFGRGQNRSRTGRMSWCQDCKRKFVQGGLKDLQKYHLVIEKRIAELKLPKDVASEVLQTASVDVLAGKGYCWSVELKAKEAWRDCRGEFGQRGSDHPAFRAQNGQPRIEE